MNTEPNRGTNSKMKLLARVFSAIDSSRGFLLWPVLFLTLLGAAAAWAAWQGMGTTPPEMAAMLPQGALMTVESRDFAGLLKQWNNSAEKSAWLKSADYSVFSNSHLFGRLGGAQEEFAAAAGLPPDMAFLNEVAGRESIFAWYDIGNLEFLYITHMPTGTATQTQLMQMRSKFDQRQIGQQVFYVRTGQGSDANQVPGSTPRTVAFATSGDWLLLATREDLMADALTLMAEGGKSRANSLAGEKWYSDASAAAATQKDYKPGELHMTLNLAKIVPLPHFRSYWVQQNITEMKQYRSTVADLYADQGGFREERVLLPSKLVEDASVDSPASPDLSALVALVPARAGVFRAVSTPDAKTAADTAVATLDEKLLQRTTGTYKDLGLAPQVSLAIQQEGSAGDLETRIDTPLRVHPAKGAELQRLRQAMETAEVNAMMTVGRTGEMRDGIWVPFESAVVLSASHGWDAATMQTALQEALGERLTTGNLGLTWKPVKAGSGEYFEISETRPLEMAIMGRILILSDDARLMKEMMGLGQGLKLDQAQKDKGATGAGQATLIAGFTPREERASFVRWTAIVDHPSDRTELRPAEAGSRKDDGKDTNGDVPSDSAGEPAFFARNMRSLSDSFSALESERVVERKEIGLTRQTVTYTWQR